MANYQQVTFADSPHFDAFGRLRVSQPIDLFDNMSEYGNDAVYWETKVSGGTVLDQGYLTAAGATRGTGTVELFKVAPLVYTGLNSTQDILTVAVQTLTGSGTANGAITWVEEY